MTTYKIQSGDTLTSIAKKYNTTVDAIANANGIKNKNLIYAGHTLTIPDGHSYGENISSGSAGSSSSGITSGSAAKDIEKWKDSRPASYKNSYSDKIKELVSTLSGMDFSYEPENDLAYRLIRDENRKNARFAMEDALGKALSLTGGYSNSYGLSAAQQAYADELSETVAMIPELYKAAYDRFDNERDHISDSIKLLSDLDDAEFDKYNDMLKQYLTEGKTLFDNYESLSKEEFDRFLDYAEFLQKASK
ncbi:MAG: LysM peptidoglycan-binding domain-containing protein [Clostridia bacterium]|nr:LysM peptidoglycan-binding domain-containing protein [Clostridia bacterium]